MSHYLLPSYLSPTSNLADSRMQPRTKAPRGYSACRISLKDSGQPLRQLPSCIHGASPYLYPATDNARRTYSNHVLTYNTLPYSVQTVSLHLPVRQENCRRTTQPAIFPMHIIARTLTSSQTSLLGRSTNSTDRSTSFLLAKAL